VTPNLNNLAISSSGFVFDPATGATYTANPSGRKILEGLRDGRTLDEIAQMLSACFKVGEVDLRRDVLEYVRTLRHNGLLAADFELA